MKLLFEQTIIGRIGLAEENGSITALFFPDEAPPAEAVVSATPLLSEAFRQLHAWLAGEREIFELPLAPHGSDFMQRVWQELCRIPYGATASYGAVATAVGSPKGARAVGLACNRNPIPIIIPCHRVIGSSGKLVGYGGGLAIKEKLLALERGR